MKDNNLISLAIVDDELLFRQGLIALLKKHKHIKIFFDADNGNTALDKLRKLKTLPEIILTDLKMPDLNGVEMTKILRKEFPELKIIALTSYYSKPFIINMISIGAVAYLAKNSTPSVMLKTIEEVHKKGFYYDNNVLKYIHEELLNPSSQNIKSTFDKKFLTKREKEVLELLCQQKTTNEIATILNKSPRTIDGFRNSLLLKTESKNIAGLVVFAIKHKLVSIDLN